MILRSRGSLRLSPFSISFSAQHTRWFKYLSNWLLRSQSFTVVHFNWNAQAHDSNPSNLCHTPMTNSILLVYRQETIEQCPFSWTASTIQNHTCVRACNFVVFATLQHTDPACELGCIKTIERGPLIGHPSDKLESYNVNFSRGMKQRNKATTAADCHAKTASRVYSIVARFPEKV